MFGIAKIAFALSAAMAVSALPAAAQDVKLYADGNKLVGVYKHSYALVIGNHDYKPAVGDLPNVRSDVALVSGALRERGFETEVYENLTGRQLDGVIEDFTDKHGYQDNTRILIWYAGHGVTVDGEGYVLGTDAPLLAEDSSSLDADLQEFYRAAMPLRKFGIILRQMRAKHVLLVLDSCFSATIFDNTRSASQSLRLREVEMANPTRQIITSGSAGQKVLDDGHFARLFVDAVKGSAVYAGKSADQNGDNYLSGSELGFFLTQAAENLTQKPQFGKLTITATSASSREGTNDIKVGNDDFSKGEFFFVLPGMNAPSSVEVATRSTEEPAPVVWRALASGTRIANLKPDPAPVFDGTPPAVGAKKFDLLEGQQYPPAMVEAVLEQATIGAESWVRFRRDDTWYYVREGDVEIIRSP
jgi:hypothetical protein